MASALTAPPAASDDGPMFRRTRRGGRVQDAQLTVQSIRQIVKMRARAAGIKGRISGRSLRVGSAQSLTTAGAELPEQMNAGPLLPNAGSRGGAMADR